MGMEFVRQLPKPDDFKKEYALADSLKAIKEARDKEISDVLTGKSDKFLVIIGPCSADREDALLDYISRLAKVNEKVKDKLVIIPRIYTNKPRTTGEAIRESRHSQILRRSLTLLRDLSQSAQCI